MTKQEILFIIEKKIKYYKSEFRIMDMKEDFSAGALEALISLLEEIEESED